MIYGYARISTDKQNMERQIRNILAVNAQAKIYQEVFTGTKTTGRRKLEALLKRVQSGDTIIFDSVSRMSRDAEEGYALYKELYDKGIRLTELLRGEKIDTQKNIDKKEIEELVVGSLDMAVRDSIHQHRKNWILAYLLCFFISITEIIMLVVSGSSLAEMKGDILLVTGGMLLFGAWFCFFAKDILPTYYDDNKINYVSQGIFRIHLVGLSFNNGNWIYICTTLKIWILATVVLYPLAGIIIINCFNIALWDILNNIFLIMILGGMVVSIYIIGKKYE